MGPLTHHASVATVVRVSVAVVLGIAFFWWGLHFLVGGRVSYRAALPGAVATVAFLAGLRAFSALVFQPLIVGNAVTYGALGTVLIVQSWLIGVGWVHQAGRRASRPMGVQAHRLGNGQGPPGSDAGHGHGRERMPEDVHGR